LLSLLSILLPIKASQLGQVPDTYEAVTCPALGTAAFWKIARLEVTARLKRKNIRSIADFLGLTIETVSRVLAKLEREDVVRLVPKGLQLMGSNEWPLLLERSYKVT
jgi:hypothetical protein